MGLVVRGIGLALGIVAAVVAGLSVASENFRRDLQGRAVAGFISARPKLRRAIGSGWRG